MIERKDKERWLWILFGTLSIITIMASAYNKIALFIDFYHAGMSAKNAFDAFLVSGLFLYLITLIIGISAFVQWKSCLILNLFMLYPYGRFFYDIYLANKVTFSGHWVLARNISAISGVLMSLCGLILLFIYLCRFFKTKKQ